MNTLTYFLHTLAVRTGLAPRPVLAPTPSGIHVGPPELYPNPTITPGALNPAVTQATISKTIGVPGWTARVRPPSWVTARWKVELLKAYGFADQNPAHCEGDHFLPIELGGAPADKRNFWPQMYAPYATGKVRVGAGEKDLLENYLHKEVVAGRMTLIAAQNEILIDWYAAFLRHKL